jgi:hypothetical protein
MAMGYPTRRVAAILLVLVVPVCTLLLLASALPAAAGPAIVTPLPPVQETDGYAGVCYSFYPDPQTEQGRPFVPLAYDAGSRWDRFDFCWHRFEPADNVWDSYALDGYDSLVNDLHDAGMNVVGILLWTPDWAATGGAASLMAPSIDRRPPGWYAPFPRDPLASLQVAAVPTSSPPQGLYEEWDDWTWADGDPVNYWGRFVHTIVSRYGDRVTHWEVWNEPEWSYFWTGTSTDYAQLLKVGYRATKAACGDCSVLFGGLHYWANPNFYWWVLHQLDQDPTAPESNHFFDVMSVHLYARSSSIYDVVNSIRGGMTAYHVGDHPIWLTETGASVWDDDLADPDPSKYDWGATQEESAAFVVQSYANALAGGVERYLLFRTHDSDMGELFGMVRNDLTLRPSYVAYQVATTYLVSPSMTTSWSYGDGTRRVTLWGTPRGKVSVLWNTLSTTHGFDYPATVPAATKVDRSGVTGTITAAGGVFGLTLPGATANLVSNPADYIIGGDPLLVIESEAVNRPPTCTVRPLPSMTSSFTFTVAWEGEDDETGVWRYDVQMRDGEGGEWAALEELVTYTSTEVVGEHAHTYYFRARAWDYLGNRGDWLEMPQAETTVLLLSTLRLSAGAFFADENRDGVWNVPISDTGEITLTQVALRFLDETGHDVISATVGSSWEFTTTVYVNQPYELRASSSGHVRFLGFSWPLAGQVYTETYAALGLFPVEWSYLPLVLRE